MPQPYDYTIRPTGQSPIRTASGLIGLQQNYQQQQQQQAEQQRQAQFRMGLQQLDPNDPAAAQALAQQYPGQIEQIQGFQGFANEQQQMQVRDAAGGMITAAQSGDPELLQQTIDQYAPVISGTGNPSITPEVLKRIARNKPETFLQMMKGSYGRAGGDLKQLGIEDKVLQQMGTGAMAGYSYDPATGNFSIQDDIKANLIKDAEKKASKEGQLGFKEVKELQGEVTKLTKDANAIKVAAIQLSTLGKLKSPAAQIALLTKYMKTLDPNSTVTATEHGMVASASGPAEALAGLINRVGGTGPMSESVINDIIVAGQSLANDAIRGSDSAVRDYMDVFGDKVDEESREKLFKRIPEVLEVTGIIPETPPPATTTPESQASAPVVPGQMWPSPQQQPARAQPPAQQTKDYSGGWR